jgi:hypothetical protein
MSSEKGIFSIYYGEGNVIYGPNGVDLSEFNCTVRGITRPHERTNRCKLFQAIQEQAPYGYVQEAMQGNESAKI